MCFYFFFSFFYIYFFVRKRIFLIYHLCHIYLAKFWLKTCKHTLYYALTPYFSHFFKLMHMTFILSFFRKLLTTFSLLRSFFSLINFFSFHPLFYTILHYYIIYLLNFICINTYFLSTKQFPVSLFFIILIFFQSKISICFFYVNQLHL